MKTLTKSLIATAFALSACAATEVPETQAAPVAASMAKSVVDPLIGKRLVANDIVFIFNSNGTMGGDFRGTPVVGTYEAGDKEVCSKYTSPANLVGKEYCSVPMIKGNVVNFVRRDGSQADYLIEC